MRLSYFARGTAAAVEQESAQVSRATTAKTSVYKVSALHSIIAHRASRASPASMDSLIDEIVHGLGVMVSAR